MKLTLKQFLEKYPFMQSKLAKYAGISENTLCIIKNKTRSDVVEPYSMKHLDSAINKIGKELIDIELIY